MNEGYRYVERIGASGEGRSVLDHLVGAYPHSDAKTWRTRIEAGEVDLDGHRPEPEALLRAGQTLAWHRPPWEEPQAPLAFSVVYDDDAIVVVDKPSGLPTLPGAGFLQHTLLHQVRRQHGAVDPLHRLGRGTSGLVLFARTPEASRKLSAALRDREGVEKIYRALVEGSPPLKHFEIDTPIGRVKDPVVGELFAASAQGKPSLSLVDLIEARGAEIPGETSLVDVRIFTGRPHQIRIHLAAAGHPLAGDPLYGVGGGRRPGSDARPGDVGYLLHAHRLSFEHPTQGRRLSLVAPLPAPLTTERA